MIAVFMEFLQLYAVRVMSKGDWFADNCEFIPRPTGQQYPVGEPVHGAQADVHCTQCRLAVSLRLSGSILENQGLKSGDASRYSKKSKSACSPLPDIS